LEVSGPHFIFGKIKVHVSQSRPAGTRKTLPAIASANKIELSVNKDKWTDIQKPKPGFFT
jgi:hypothetical protein